MKKIDLTYFFTALFLIVFSGVLLFIGIFKNSIVPMIIGLILLTILIAGVILVKSDDITDKIIKGRINKLNKTEYLSTFDNFYLSVYKNNSTYLKKLKEKKLSISNLYFKAYKRYIFCRFNYVNFGVYLKIHKKSVKYRIDCSIKYSNSGWYKKIIKGKKSILINNLTLDEFDNYFVNLIDEMKQYIKDYKENNQVDSNFNGKLYEKLYFMKSYFRNNGIAIFTLSTILLFSLIYITYLAIRDIPKENNSFTIFLSIICFIGLWFLIILGLYSGIFRTIIWCRLKRDIKNKETIKIEGHISKVKLGIEAKARHKLYYNLEYIMVYVNEMKIIIPTDKYIKFDHKNYKNKCIKELEGLNCNITVLKTSKVAINGHAKFLNIAEKILCQ